jgi:PAS domain S-box-containing protein
VAVAEACAVTDARSMLAAILEVAEDGIYAMTLDGTIVAWNHGAERIYGYAAEQILGKPVSLLVPKDRNEEMATILAQIRRGETIEHLETIRLRSTGSPIEVWKWVAPTRDDRGHVTGAVAIVRDVTPIQQALRQTEESNAQLRSQEEMLRQALKALRKSHEEQKATQLQLIQSAKLESVGRLAAGVAHEVKNPLAIILMAAENLSAAIEAPDPDTAAALADIQDSVRRADSVIRGLLDFSTATDLTTQDEDVNEVLERAISLVRHALTKSKVTLVKEFEEGLPQVVLDRTKIEQVFVNLLINAIDAMPAAGGTLTVSSFRDQVTEVGPGIGHRRTDTLRIGQSVIVVTVEDTGTGIDEQAMARLFDPFFTTKPPGKGTGLGLAVCRSIIALHGGTIQMSNRAVGGARATVMFQSSRR